MFSNLTIWVAKVLQISSETVGEEVEGKKPIVVKCPQHRQFRALGPWSNQPPWELSLPGGRPGTASLGKVASHAVTQQPGTVFQPGGERITSLAEVIHLALSQERWDNFQRWQGKDEDERRLLFRNLVLTAVCQSNPI